MFDTPDLDLNHWNIYARRDCKLKYWHITHNIVYLSFDLSTNLKFEFEKFEFEKFEIWKFEFSFCINYFCYYCI